MKKEIKPIKELNQIKKWVKKNYGKPCYKDGKIAIGCIGCQVWRAIDILEQALDIIRN